MSEKYLKKIAEELQLIREEIQYHNDVRFESIEEEENPAEKEKNIPIADQLNKMFGK